LAAIAWQENCYFPSAGIELNPDFRFHCIPLPVRRVRLRAKCTTGDGRFDDGTNIPLIARRLV